VRALLSKTSCLRHPADEHLHLRHGAMIWHNVPHHRTKRKLRGHCRVRTKFPVSFEDIRISHVVLRKRRVEVPKKSSKLTCIFASTGLRTQIGFSTASGLAHPS